MEFVIGVMWRIWCILVVTMFEDFGKMVERILGKCWRGFWEKGGEDFGKMLLTCLRI